MGCKKQKYKQGLTFPCPYQIILYRCEKERPEQIFQKIMDILTNVDGRITSLDNKVEALTAAHFEHEKVHFKNMELTQDKMTEMDYQILEIRTLTGFSRTRDSIVKGVPGAKKEDVTNMLAKLYGVDGGAREKEEDTKMKTQKENQ